MGQTRRYFASSDNYCLVGYKQDAMLSVYIIGVGYYILQICRLIRSQVFGFACKCYKLNK